MPQLLLLPPPKTDLTPQELLFALEDHDMRMRMLKGPQGFRNFCLNYLPHYFHKDPADFFNELTGNLGDMDILRLLVVGFRGSAKSTFATTALVLYSALVYPDLFPFIVPVVATGPDATVLIAGIKHELETNEMIKDDFGVITFSKVGEVRPQRKLESKEEWQARNLVLSTGVRITARSKGMRFRSLRHRQYRPRLVVADDVENLKDVRTQESRDATARWWRGEVIGALDQEYSRVVLIGNWLHEDGLLARMKTTGIYKVLEYFLLREGEGTEIERCRWRAMYPTQESIDLKRDEMGEIAFRREMLGQIVPEEGQDVLESDITYYDDPPFDNGNYLAYGVDLAISTKQSADYTSAVCGEVTEEEDRVSIYIQPNPFNEHVRFLDAMDAFTRIRDEPRIAIVREYEPGMHLSSHQFVKDIHGKKYVCVEYKMSSMWFVESVQYQMAAVEEMERRGFSVEGMHPVKDKRARLRIAARYIKNGTVKFPRKGCELLIRQMLGMGIEKHDDLVDALVWLILGILQDNGITPQTVDAIPLNQ